MIAPRGLILFCRKQYRTTFLLKTFVENMKAVRTHDDCFRIVVLGSKGVGKSAIVVRYLTRRFIWEYDSTADCLYKHQSDVDNETTTIEILDTTGHADNFIETYSNVDGANSRCVDAFLLVYSITDAASFHEISSIKRQLNDSTKFPSNIPCVLVGNKMDMEHERKITQQDGEDLAAQLHCPFFELTASDGGPTIPEVFSVLCREIRRDRLAIESRKIPLRRRTSAHRQVLQAFNRVLTKLNGRHVDNNEHTVENFKL